MMTIRELYIKASFAGIVSMALESDIKRAQRIYRKLQKDPGDCAGDIPLLKGLAIAEAHLGKSPGWIPVVQRIGCQIARLEEQSSLSAE